MSCNSMHKCQQSHDHELGINSGFSRRTVVNLVGINQHHILFVCFTPYQWHSAKVFCETMAVWCISSQGNSPTKSLNICGKIAQDRNKLEYQDIKGGLIKKASSPVDVNKPSSTTKYILIRHCLQPHNFLTSAEEIGIARHMINGITFSFSLSNLY